MKQLLIFILFTSTLFAQNKNEIDRELISFSLNEIAMLNLAPDNNTVFLNLNSPSQPGDPVSFTDTNNSKWVNFTSALAEGSPNRNLYVKIENGTIPSGLNLKLDISNYSGNGNGQLGTKTGTLILNSNNQAIVSNIGGAYTGYGSNNGYKLTYFLEITDYELLNIDNSEVLTISLTLTDF